MLYTSYFGYIKNIPRDFLLVSIARVTPKGLGTISYEKLAPQWDLVNDTKQIVKSVGTLDYSRFRDQYTQSVLVKLDPQRVVRDLETLRKVYKRKCVCLLCYELPSDVCHRQLVAEWLRANGFECEEYRVGG